MPRKQQRLTIVQGEDWSWRWPVLAQFDGGAQDLTGWTARGQIRATRTDPAVLYEWSVPAGNVAMVPNAGSSIPTNVQITVPAEDSAAWSFVDGVYDIELTDQAGKITRIAEGPVWVDGEVTREPGRTAAAHLWIGHGTPGTITNSTVGDQYLDVDSGDLYTLEA